MLFTSPVSGFNGVADWCVCVCVCVCIYIYAKLLGRCEKNAVNKECFQKSNQIFGVNGGV